MKNSLFLKLIKKKSEQIIKVDYANTELFKRKNDIIENLKSLTFNITRQYDTINLKIPERNFAVICEDDGRFYESLTMLVEIKICENEYFVRFKLEITPFKCCTTLDSFNYGNVDVEQYFNEHKTQCDLDLTRKLKRILKEKFGKSYIKMYKNYRNKILDNDISILSNRLMKECQSLENICNYDINDLIEM